MLEGVSGSDEEYGAADHAVCADQHVVAAWQINGSAGLSAPENKFETLQGRKVSGKATKSDAIAGNVSCDRIIGKSASPTRIQERLFRPPLAMCQEF